MAYTYRFIDQDNRIIYVGKTVNIDLRMGQHFGGKGHLSQDCYKAVARVEYQKWKTESDALIMEQYYIAKYDPRYNKLGKSRDIPTLKLEEGKWKLYREYKPQRPPVKLEFGWLQLGFILFAIYEIIKYVANVIH